MITNQVIQTSIDELSEITKVNLCVLDLRGSAVAETFADYRIDRETITNFADSAADSQVIQDQHLLKIYDEGILSYILLAKGGEDTYMVGKVAVCQLQNLIVAYKEKVDRNSFFQNLILDNLLLVDIYNRAKKLHIPAEQDRAVFVIETKTEKDMNAREMVTELFSSQNGDYITAVDEKHIIVIKALARNESYEALEEVAKMLVDMLNSEAMTTVRVAYGTIVNEIKEISKSYKEAKMALDVGKIFYVEKVIIAYNTLGIGRLIYQLPVNLCQIFIDEIFGDSTPDDIDDEILMTANKFFDNSLNVSETSRQLYIHRNTLVYRLEKLQKSTGLDIRVFDDALTLKIALMVVNYMKYVESLEY
ncbi:MAG TPA: helix-turn-helix domain-containing protein [Lachnospiraceae bacterium]|nr:helix-turn-helix domain-containing protein [Lachnospiraceae bacterium]